MPDKTTVPLSPARTPDFLVACLTFDDGVVARLTCSIVAPHDHRVRLVGDQGVVLDEVWHNRSPVRLETFTPLSLNARKLRAVRHSPPLGRLTGVEGRPHRYPREQPVQQPGAENQAATPGRSFFTALKGALRRRQMTSLDFLLGVADMERAQREGRDPVVSPGFLLHVSEVTLAGASGDTRPRTVVPPHTFGPLQLDREAGAPWSPPGPGLLTQVTDRLLVALHRRGRPAADRGEAPTQPEVDVQPEVDD
ncbi:MAG: hypothetical protein ACRYG2_01155 [Janthinobacterium lividum]